MKMKKVLSLVMLLVVLVMVVSGCGLLKDKVAIDNDKFIEVMEENGFDDILDTTWLYGKSVEAVSTASNDTYQVWFFVLTSVEEAEGTYAAHVKIFEGLKTSSSTKKELNAKNYNSYNLSTDSLFCFAYRVDNTFIYGKIPVAEKDEIKKIIEIFGY